MRKTYHSSNLPRMKWITCQGRRRLPSSSMMLGWLNCHACSLPYQLIFTAVQPGRWCRKDLALSFVLVRTHTQSFLSHMHKAHSGVPLKGTDSENMLQKGTHTSHFKAQHWKNTSKNKNNLSRKTTMVHFPLRKINSSQVRRCGQVHTEFLQQRKRKPSLCSVSKHNTDNLVWRRAQATVNNIFSVLRVNQERFTVQEFSWWVTLMASAVSSRWPLIPTSSQLQAADNEEYKGQSQCSHG